MVVRKIGMHVKDSEALKARYSKAQGGAKRNPGLGSEHNGSPVGAEQDERHRP
jgi:hypothetical protein